MGKEIHVKTHVRFFTLWISRRKSFEVRKNDRDYQTGDVLYQHEYDPITKTETGRVGVGHVGFVLHHEDFSEGTVNGYVTIECPFLKMVVKPSHDYDT